MTAYVEHLYAAVWKYLTIACGLNLSLFLAASFAKPLFNDSAAIIQSIPLYSVQNLELWFPLRKLFLGHSHLRWWIINKCRASICKKARAPILKPDFWRQSGPLRQPHGEAKCGVYDGRHEFTFFGARPFREDSPKVVVCHQDLKDHRRLPCK